jgi:hypothetical protein
MLCRYDSHPQFQVASLKERVGSADFAIAYRITRDGNIYRQGVGPMAYEGLLSIIDTGDWALKID